MQTEKLQPTPILVIGATCVDVVISLDRLPVRGGHCKVMSQKISAGGCAYNVASFLRREDIPVTFITPVGTGLYGGLVRKALCDQGFPVNIEIPEENGCCYCLVEPDGERSFIPFHGSEYTFKKEWMKDITPSEYAYVYVCGIEVNEPTGKDIVSWLEENRGPSVFFAPSPHIKEIKPALVNRLLDLHPILHMNKEESFLMSGKGNVSDAAISLRERSGNAVIITLGAEGALCLEKEGEPYMIPAGVREVVDTTGAGDAHAGAVLSALSRELSMREAITLANEAAADIVTIPGASPDDSTHTRSAIS